MKQFIVICLAFFTIGGMSACQDEEKIISEFSITKQSVKEKISAKETAEIGLKINRGKGYKGNYYILYNQSSGNGLGTVIYNGAVLKAKEKKKLVSDNVNIRYTAITDNFHQLDFSIINDINKRVDASVIFNEDKRGNSDNLFNVTNQTIANKIRETETVTIRLQLDKGKAYTGKYFIQYNQSIGNGLGKLTYNGREMQNGQPYEITNEFIQLPYSAITNNYHELDILVFDEYGLRKNLVVVFNEDKKGIDDFLFSASLPNMQKKIKENESVKFKIKLDKSKAYSGKYFIKYAQRKGHGFGKLSLGDKVMSKEVAYEITDDVDLTYESLSEFYHQLELTIFNELNKKINLDVIFNTEMKIYENDAFAVTYDNYQSNIGDNRAKVYFHLKKIDKDFKGKHYFKWVQISGEGELWKDDINSSGSTGIPVNLINPVELTTKSDNSFSIQYEPKKKNSYHEIKLIFQDYFLPQATIKNEQEIILKFNEHLKGK